jgi:hypothetical protein
MKLASIVVSAQHPDGLRLHLDNLQWALGMHDSYVLTFKAWNFDHAKYPGINFISVDGDPLQFHYFWEMEIPELIRSVHADVFLFTELDMYFHTPAARASQTCHREQVILMDELEYPDAISGLRSGGRELYPRIWENAAFIPGPVLREALSEGIALNRFVRHPRILSSLASPERGDLYVRQCTGKEESLSTLCRNGEFQADTLFEFTLFCFLKQVPFRKVDLIVHLPKPEAHHRRVPAAYKSPGGAQRLLDYYSSRNDRIHIPSTLFMYYLSGALELEPEMRQLWRGNIELARKLQKVAPLAKEWMQDSAYERFLRALAITCGEAKMI